jgi:fibronectin type 3 domain-containing protein
VSYKIVIQATANHVVDMSWSSSTSTDVVGYNIYRSPDGATWRKLNAGLIASTLYSDSTVANGSTYYYAATTVGTDGKESSKTTAVKVTVP